jgi:hypothetical protein
MASFRKKCLQEPNLVNDVAAKRCRERCNCCYGTGHVRSGVHVGNLSSANFPHTWKISSEQPSRAAPSQFTRTGNRNCRKSRTLQHMANRQKPNYGLRERCSRFDCGVMPRTSKSNGRKCRSITSYQTDSSSKRFRPASLTRRRKSGSSSSQAIFRLRSTGSPAAKSSPVTKNPSSQHTISLP